MKFLLAATATDHMRAEADESLFHVHSNDRLQRGGTRNRLERDATLRLLGTMQIRRVMGISAACACLVSPSALAQKNPGLSTRPAGKSLTSSNTAPTAPVPELRRDSVELPFDAAIRPTPEEEKYLEEVKNGHTWAITRLGVLYARTDNDPKRWSAAFTLLEKAGAQKDAEALFQLAMMARAGRGMPASDTAAFDYCWRAAELGMPEAQYELASMYAQGLGTVKNEDAAINWARKAADQGNDEALVLLARLLLESPDSANRSEAMKRLNQAADEGKTPAILFLATMCARGEFRVPVDEARAESLLKPAAEKGDAECQFALASLYAFGNTFSGQRGLADEWLKRAAKAGHAKAAQVLSGEEALQAEQR